MGRRSTRPADTSVDELSLARAFLQVVKAGGFSAAAKVLNKSTSSVSRAVAELEQRLGAQLLARTTRRLHLTEAGSLYAAHAEALLDAVRASHDAIFELTGGVPRGHLRVSMPVSVGERLMEPVVAELRQRYPELRLELDLSDRNVHLVEEGFDLAIRVGRLEDSSLRAQLLAKVPVRLVASPSYVARRKQPTHPQQLAEHECISVGRIAGAEEWTFHPRGSRRASQRVLVDGVIRTTSPLLGAQLAVKGLGVLRVVEWAIRDELRRGELVEVMADWSCDHPSTGGIPVYVLYAQTGGVAPPLKSKLFVELVKGIVQREGLGSRRPLGVPKSRST